MILRPPRATPTATLFPPTTLFRSRPLPRPLRHAVPHREGALPQGRRPDGGEILDRPAADDPRRRPAARPDAPGQPLPEHRPRHPRLDPGARVGAHPRRPAVPPATRYPARRPHHRPLLARAWDLVQGNTQNPPSRP